MQTQIVKDVRFAEVDVTDQNQVDAWIDVKDRSAAADLVDWPPESRPHRIIELTRAERSARTDHIVAIVDDQVIGTAELWLPMADNTGLVEIELDVDPAWRRRGVGAALLREIEARARREGRHILLGWAARQREDGVWCDDAGERFALAHGYQIATQEVHSRVDLSLGYQDDRDELLAKSWQAAGEYESISYVNRAPDDMVDGIAYLVGRLNTDAPTGDMALENENIDAARLRDSEVQGRARGALRVSTAVRHRESGAVAGYTSIVARAGAETHCWQGVTIVDPEHRGHRIGTILKLENHRELSRYRPRMRYIHTWNDGTNAHMIAINEAIGYRARETWLAMQKKDE